MKMAKEILGRCPSLPWHAHFRPHFMVLTLSQGLQDKKRVWRGKGEGEESGGEGKKSGTCVLQEGGGCQGVSVVVVIAPRCAGNIFRFYL